MGAVLPTSTEARKRDLYPETRKVTGPSLVVSTQKSVRHDWQVVLKDRTRILSEVSGHGILRDDQFGFRPKHNTALQLISLAERFPGTLVRRSIGAVFLDVAKAFSTL